MPELHAPKHNRVSSSIDVKDACKCERSTVLFAILLPRWYMCQNVDLFVNKEVSIEPQEH